MAKVAYNKLQGKKILWLAASPSVIMQFYLPHIKNLVQAGAVVMVASNVESATAEKKILSKLGVAVHHLPIKRGGKNIVAELKTMVMIARLVLKLRPDMINALALKMVLYGGMVARWVPAVARVMDMIGRVGGGKVAPPFAIKFLGNLTGLGFIFISQGLFAKTVRLGLRIILPHIFSAINKKLLVMNSDDYQLMATRFRVPKKNIVKIFGVGVDSDKFAPAPSDNPTQPKKMIITIARLLRDKGITEFCQAIKILRDKNYRDNFYVYGARDKENPSSLSAQEIKDMEKSGVRFMGHTKDIKKAITPATAVVLFSYREGMPQVLLEAASMAKPLIALNAPGSREICRDNISGLLVKDKNPQSLAKAMEKILTDDKLRHRLGRGGRRLIEETFALKKIEKQMLALWQKFF